MTKVFKIKSITFLVLCILAFGSFKLAYNQQISAYCNSGSLPTETLKVRDWVVENPFSSGFLFSLTSLTSSNFGSGGVKAEARDPYAVGLDAYCINVMHATNTHKAGKAFGYLVTFMIVFFGFAVLTRKLKEAIKRK